MHLALQQRNRRYGVIIRVRICWLWNRFPVISLRVLSPETALIIYILRIREYVEVDEVVVKWIGTKEKMAHSFTKVLLGPALAILKDKVQLMKFGSCEGVL